jgi:hypothetical protein
MSDESKPEAFSDHGGDDPFCLLRPRTPALGSLAAFARISRIAELEEYERTKCNRIWRVRGVVSDHVPLIGTPSMLIDRQSFSHVLMEESPLTLFLHLGGWNAIYFDFVSGDDKQLKYIEVRVESKLPSVALTLALRPLNAFLDLFASKFNLPLCLQRLELVSPRDGDLLIYQALLPAKDAVVLGHLGGFIQAESFAPYDAIYREALVSNSPFYRLLCAARMYEGTNTIRRWLKELCTKRKVNSRLPPDPLVDQERLLQFGFTEEACFGIRTTQDLFHKLKHMRDGIAHFLIEHEGANTHVYLADGHELQNYSVSAAALLYYAHGALEGLRSFYTKEIGSIPLGSVLPTIEQRDRFIVRASDFELE